MTGSGKKSTCETQASEIQKKKSSFISVSRPDW